MAWELIALLTVLFMLVIVLKVVHMFLHNVKCLDEFSRLNRHYRKRIKALEEDTARLTQINAQLRSRQQELLEENIGLRRKTERLNKDLSVANNKLAAANLVIEQNNARINRRIAQRGSCTTTQSPTPA